MFKKHSVQMKYVKDAPKADSDSARDYVHKLRMTSVEADETIKSLVRAAVTITAVKTAAELTLHIAKTYIK